MPISRSCLVVFGLTTLALLAGCAPQRGPAPAELLIQYEWREGSLPPPYHYAYSITLRGDGSGTMTMVPDYRGEGVPSWSEPFNVPRAELDHLYDLMLAQGLFSRPWRAVDDPPVGGSSEGATISADGRTVTIPAFLPPDQQPHAAAIYAALRSMVPQTIVADLEARRAAYQAEHERP